MTDNIDKKDSGLAEALYHKYRANRQGGVKYNSSSQESIEQSEIEPEIGSESAMNAISLYAQHQRMRTNRSEEMSVDSLLGIMDKEHHSEIMSRLNQPDIADSAPAIESIGAKQGHIASQDDAINAADRRPASWWIPRIAGVAAAALLALVLAPQLMTAPPLSGNSPDNLPIALSTDAPRAIEFIELASVDSFGFSDNNSVEKYAFNAGVLGVDLRLAIAGSNQQLTKTVLKTLLSSTVEQSAITSDTRNIQGNIQTLYTAIDSGITNTNVNIQVQDLLASLQQTISQENQLDWYLAGSSVESIRLASEIALEHSDVTALEQALNQGEQVNSPENLPTIASQYSELVNYPLVEKDKFIQINEIKTMTEDLKMVMR